MFKIAKRITALGLAAVTALMSGITANAASKPFTGTSGYKVTFDLSASVSTYSGAMRRLDVDAIQRNVNNQPYVYPHIYMKGILYTSEATNYISEKTQNDVCDGNIIVTGSAGNTTGHGYGEFHAYGCEVYGDVYGSIDV